LESEATEEREEKKKEDYDDDDDDDDDDVTNISLQIHICFVKKRLNNIIKFIYSVSY
jgi:hypothetical protein